MPSKLGSEWVPTPRSSHTGLTDKASVGNAEADKLANWATLEEDDGKYRDINKAHNELQYCMTTRKTTGSEEKGYATTHTVAHGSIKDFLKDQAINRQIATWTERRKRGEVVRESKKGTMKMIKYHWNKPKSITIKYMLDILNQADPHTHEGHHRMKDTCRCCGHNHYAPNDALHRIGIGCPSKADLWNDADAQILEIIGQPC